MASPIGGTWVIKSGDFQPTPLVSTEAGILAALTYIGPGGLGEMYLAPGTYTLAATLDLTSLLGITIRGAGPRRTKLIFSTTSTAAINVANASTRFMKLADMTIQGSAGVAQTSPTAGGYGIRVTAGVGFSLVIDHCEINFFKNSGILVEGPTGPTRIRDCSIQGNAGYGVEVVNQGGSSPQDVCIEGGNIQDCLGGVLWNQAFSCHLDDCDVELSNSALYPCLNILGASYGNTVTDSSMSQSSGASPSPNCVVNNAAGIGVTIIGGINSAKNGGDNIIAGATCDRMTVIGGEYTNKTPGGGYFMNFSGGTRTAVINPLLVSSTYTTGKDIVNDASGNFTFAFGVKTAARSSDDQGMSAKSMIVDTFGLTGNLTMKNTLAVDQRALGPAADELTFWPIRSGFAIQWNNFANSRNNMTLTDAGALSTFSDMQTGGRVLRKTAATLADTATPSVAGGDVWLCTPAAPTALTDFTGGSEGQEIDVIFTNANASIIDGGNFRLNGDLNPVAANDMITLKRTGGVWYEKSRSPNG